MPPISTTDRLSAFMQSDAYQDKNPHYKRMILLAEKIYGHRKDLNLSQKELAEKAHTTQRIISELENVAYNPSQGVGEELFEKIALALGIDVDYLFSDKMDRKTFELFAYVGKKMHWKWDIMQFMKLPYFVDVESVKILGFQITNFKYVRSHYGPFDKKVYYYRNLFEDKKYEVKFSYIKDFLSVIDSALTDLPIKNGERLKRQSYETAPMKKIGATLGGKEGWNEPLDLTPEEGIMCRNV